MLGKKPSSLGAYWEAFKVDLNLGVLVLSVLFSLLLQSWKPLIFVGAAEMLYLLIAPRLPYFAKRAEKSAKEEVERGRGQAEKAFDEECAGMMKSLSGEDLKRASRVNASRKDFLKLCAESAGEGGLLMQEDVEKVNSLFLSYLRLSNLKNRYPEHLREDHVQEINDELKKVTDELAGTKDPEVEAMLTKTSEILNKRLEQVSEISALSRRVEIQLNSIENALELVSEQAVGMKKGKDISSDLNVLLSDVEATEEVARRTGPMLEQIEGMRSKGG